MGMYRCIIAWTNGQNCNPRIHVANPISLILWMLDSGFPERIIQYFRRISQGSETPSEGRVDKESWIEGCPRRRKVEGESIAWIIKVFSWECGRSLTHLEAMQKPWTPSRQREASLEWGERRGAWETSEAERYTTVDSNTRIRCEMAVIIVFDGTHRILFDQI
jgi:hypothetical protein